MRYPLKMTANLAKYVASQRFRGTQEVSDGDDARAAARVQSDLHGLRAHPRVQIDDQRDHDGRAVPCRFGRVRRADRFDLRRRTHDLSGDRPAVARKFWIAAATSFSAPTECSSASGCTNSSRPRASSSTCTWMGWSGRTTFASSATACFARPSRASRPPRPPVSWSAPIPRSTRKRT